MPLSGIITAGGQIIGQHMANRTNIALAQQQRDWSKQMWHLQNQYNNPIQQIKRLKEAGINPALMYGQNAGGASGNAGAVGSYERAKIQSVTGGIDPISMYLGYKKQKAEIGLIESQTKKTDEETTAINVRTHYNRNQQQELEAQLRARNLSWDDLEKIVNSGVAGVREVEEYARIKGDMSRAELTRLLTEERQKVINWFNSNQLGKYLGPILQFMGTMSTVK